MIIIGIVGDIGSGKSYVAKQFGYPVFNADNEVTKIYKNSKSCFRKLKDKFPQYTYRFNLAYLLSNNSYLSKIKHLNRLEQILGASFVDETKFDNYILP